MEAYLVMILLILVLILGIIYWIIRLIKAFKKGKKRPIYIHAAILVALMIFVTWHLRIFPFSKNFYIQTKTTELTGKKFWSRNEFSFNDFSVRGEGYTIDIYKFDQETAIYFQSPDLTFFQNLPIEKDSDIRWTKTPVIFDHQNALHLAITKYGTNPKLFEYQNAIRKIAEEPGAYYAFKNKYNADIDFYLIAPKAQLVILINLNS